MKKIVLIGDSIRKGYDAYVKEKLEGQAQVFFPEENCRFAQYVYLNLLGWKMDGNWGDDVDLVHWNAGLWDVGHLMDEGTITTPEQYALTLRRIVKRIRMLFPRAVIVFATSTPVIEEQYGKDFWRKNADIEQYNAIAKEIMAELDVLVDDLYPVMKGIPACERSDMTHFYTPEGTKRIGNAVLGCICPVLGLEWEA